MPIKVDLLSKSYDDHLALNNISFEIPKGQIVGFLGPNGAGKSTLLKILTTYEKADKGEAWVNDLNITENHFDVKKHIGYLPEHNPLYLQQYPKEYLSFNATIYNSPKSRIDEVIELTGLGDVISKKIGTLSKGYRQRVGLAAAILHDPEVLLLDEPTTGLDPNQLEDIRNLIRNLGKDKTVLLSTHIMQEVNAMCDRVLIINKGNLVGDRLLNTNQENTIYEVAFDTHFNTELLKSLPHFSSFKSNSENHFEIEFSQQQQTALFDFATQHDLKLIHLKEKELNIESLFKEVTSNTM